MTSEETIEKLNEMRAKLVETRRACVLSKDMAGLEKAQAYIELLDRVLADESTLPKSAFDIKAAVA